MNKLGMLDAWKENSQFFTRRSAQSYFGTKQVAMVRSDAFGSACGASDDSKPAPKQLLAVLPAAPVTSKNF
ncbi:hypothetical protein Psch_01469 [Pelotomaculum schinkii]|uniref:Uncharacterized protein n=1 Tax=Pelotomaculum schinkii TaxID=78350 RepID=A0A4Y7RFZ3_9FIRM|nr:hypothetical protein [Pelotomaculum schinkii]TEB07914.1 hypothetical protein Psch_01469 [Pelotomaculum schinkii]